METLQRTANRGSISTGPYQITNSCKFERDNSEAILTQNQAAGNQKTWTFSAWIKRSRLDFDWDNIFGAGTAIIIFNEQDDLIVELYNGTTYKLITNRRFRDTAAWYHLVVMLDTTQGTAGNRVKIYINGVQETSLSTATYPPQDATFPLGGQGSSTNWIQLGRFYSGARHFSGYMAEVHYLNGTSEDADAFGEYDDDSGIWIPKQYTGGGYGTQGFYYKFDDSSNMGKDSSGEGHDANNLANVSAANQATDSPTNVFATLNQLQLDASVINNSATITEGATKATAKEFDVYNTFASTIGVTSGKWYAEFEYEGNQADNLVGIADIAAIVPYNSRLGKAGQWSVGLYQANGKLYITSDSGTTEQASWGASAADGDIMSVAVDMDNYFVYFAKNGTYQNSGDPTSGATGTGGVAFDSNRVVAIACSSYDQGGNEGQIYTNFGGYTAGTISSAASDANGYGTFEYAPPDSYFSLCTQNLALYGG